MQDNSFTIRTMTRFGNVPYVTIDNFEHHLPEATDLLFPFSDFFDITEPLRFFKQGYRQYLQLSPTTSHILTTSQLRTIDSQPTQVRASRISIETRGGYREVTPEEYVRDATEAGFAGIESLGASPFVNAKFGQPIRKLNDSVFRFLEQFVEAKKKLRSPIAVWAPVNLLGNPDDTALVERAQQLGPQGIVFDVMRRGSMAQIVEFIERVKPELSVPYAVKLYGFDLSQFVQAYLAGCSQIWTNAPAGLAHDGLALCFGLDKKRPKQLAVNVFAAENKDKIKAPLAKDCDCFSCTTHSLAYVHHLLRCHELTGMTLLSLHNHHYLLRFAERLRAAERPRLVALAAAARGLVLPEPTKDVLFDGNSRDHPADEVPLK